MADVYLVLSGSSLWDVVFGRMFLTLFVSSITEKLLQLSSE